MSDSKTKPAVGKDGTVPQKDIGIMKGIDKVLQDVFDGILQETGISRKEKKMGRMYDIIADWRERNLLDPKGGLSPSKGGLMRILSVIESEKAREMASWEKKGATLGLLLIHAVT